MTEGVVWHAFWKSRRTAWLLVAVSRMTCELGTVGASAATIPLRLASLETAGSGRSHGSTQVTTLAGGHFLHHQQITRNQKMPCMTNVIHGTNYLIFLPVYLTGGSSVCQSSHYFLVCMSTCFNVHF